MSEDYISLALKPLGTGPRRPFTVADPIAGNFRCWEFWSIGGLEIQTRVSCDGVIDGGHYFQSIELDM